MVLIFLLSLLTVHLTTRLLERLLAAARPDISDLDRRYAANWLVSLAQVNSNDICTVSLLPCPALSRGRQS